ncbi:hypothetical protein CEXT_246411 [Caerostris extrusa]|uniref:Uncharacterized protein n=1 Tax=Caerostris extrusa TaxID=172846 RepID=A0AAV4VX05_CAEEX|nr:hypothetical protein CEXT_246411 [Caerostris extrusa]
MKKALTCTSSSYKSWIPSSGTDSINNANVYVNVCCLLCSGLDEQFATSIQQDPNDTFIDNILHVPLKRNISNGHLQ